ncbi:hypothetical protein GCM10010324_30900 [Streptomyces hiroshimensis]|uniref:Uncharacterized protein n=1 Tax=Streptomyces hiroshimensis TaxID=66424 RepID=A0ABQ2YIH7_9ACTN|nr:hypothetical protein GCM10010324_30900 [Streptomyces hiroshimensis]
MPKTGGVPLAPHSKVVKKLPSLWERALVARTARKAAMAAMITRSRRPEPRERARKMRSPGRETVFVPVFAGGLLSAVELVMSMGISPVCGVASRRGMRLLAAVHRMV